MTENVFIQIGLNTKLEFDFLSLPSYKDINKVYLWAGYKWGIPRHLIDLLGEDPFRVVGVEMNPERVTYLREQYKDYPRIHILNRVIYSEDKEKIRHNSYSLYENKSNQDIFYETPATTLQTLCDELLAKYQARVWGVSMNIESAEKGVIEGIDWATFTKPRFLNVSMHSDEIRDYCDGVLTENGYVRFGDISEYGVYTYNEE